jgi:catechol 2,3-dioxygenase-like lactoylglutathione lyase family enzyme
MKKGVCLFLVLSSMFVVGPATHAFAKPGLGIVTVWIPKTCPDFPAGDESKRDQCFNQKQNPEFQKAFHWYKDILGFEKVFDSQDLPQKLIFFDGVAGRWIQLKFPGQDVQIVLKAGTPVTTDTSFTIALDNSEELCEYYNDLVHKGVKLDDKFGTPTHHGWAFEFAIRDPSNQQIVVGVDARSLARENQLRESHKLPPRQVMCGDELPRKPQ